MKRRLRTQKEVREERDRLERLSERWSDLHLALWFIAWLLREGPSPSSTLELLEAKAHDVLTEKYLEKINQCREKRPEHEK